ncbi:unnamed protein product [Ophioblennius macclurei]
MASIRKTPLLLLILQACIMKCQLCPSHPDENLTCYNDFDVRITCDWNSALGHTDNVCTLKTYEEFDSETEKETVTCDLKPVDVSRPALMRCTLDFGGRYAFGDEKLSISVSCGSEELVNILYEPACHVKVNLGKPDVDYTAISWSLDHMFINSWSYELQWKPLHESWNKGGIRKQEGVEQFKEDLGQELLIQGEIYEARVRMKVATKDYGGPWSEWSPPVSWVSPVGSPKQPSDFAVSVWKMIGIGVIGVVLLLIITLFRVKKTTWVYIVKRIRGPPIPSPTISLQQGATFQTWLHPYFNSDSFHSFLKPLEIVSVEFTSTLDVITPRKTEIKMTTDKSTESNGCRFSNPIYPKVSAGPPSVFLLSAGNLEACTSDTPYGPVGCGEADQHGGEVKAEEEEKKDMDFLKLFCKENSASNPVVEVVSEYEKVEKLQLERLRLQSLDSGVCSGEEVSQESVEADSITSHDEDAVEEKETDGGNGIKVDFRKLLGSSHTVSGKGSILLCSDYEAAEKLCSNSGPPSQDWNLSMNNEEQDERFSESTPFLIPRCSTLSQPPLAFTFSGQSSSSLGPLLMAAGESVEPSCDDYMPVRQEQS